MRELHDSGSMGMWAPYFEPASVALSFSDGVNELYVDSDSEITGSPKNQKLALKTYERSYPECTTEYTWGVLASMDLSSNTSRIMSNLGNQ